MSDEDRLYDAEREWSLTLQELDVVRADLARVTAERDELKQEVRLVHAYKDAALGLVPEDDVHQFFVRVKEIRASRGLPT